MLLSDTSVLLLDTSSLFLDTSSLLSNTSVLLLDTSASLSDTSALLHATDQKTKNNGTSLHGAPQRHPRDNAAMKTSDIGAISLARHPANKGVKSLLSGLVVAVDYSCAMHTSTLPDGPNHADDAHGKAELSGTVVRGPRQESKSSSVTTAVNPPAVAATATPAVLNVALKAKKLEIVSKMASALNRGEYCGQPVRAGRALICSTQIPQIMLSSTLSLPIRASRRMRMSVFGNRMLGERRTRWSGFRGRCFS